MEFSFALAAAQVGHGRTGCFGDCLRVLGTLIFEEESFWAPVRRRRTADMVLVAESSEPVPTSRSGRRVRD